MEQLCRSAINQSVNGETALDMEGGVDRKNIARNVVSGATWDIYIPKTFKI